MAMLLAALLGLCALAFVLHPIYHHMLTTRAERMSAQAEPTMPSVAEDEEMHIGSNDVVQSTEREQAARTALQEVELDFQLGNISQGDYNQLRERYTQRALVALKHRYEREQELDAKIEEQLCQMRMQEQQGLEQHGEKTE